MQSTKVDIARISNHSQVANYKTSHATCIKLIFFYLVVSFGKTQYFVLLHITIKCLRNNSKLTSCISIRNR